MKKVIIIITALFGILLAYLILPPPFSIETKAKIVHISFDDVHDCLQEITQDSTKYATIKEHPFFALLDEMHAKYGCKFSLYCYYKINDFTLEDVTHRYKKEFLDRADWLKFGFHAIQPGFDIKRDGNLDSLSFYYERSLNAIKNFAGSSSISQTLRLNRFYCTEKQLMYLYSMGVNTLMGADDDRISYSLTSDENNMLVEQGRCYKKGMTILRTNIRLENILLPETAIYNNDKDTLVIFTHERELGIAGRWKLKRMLGILSNNVKYIN